MSYLTQAEIADSATMTARVAQCAATQDLGDGVDPDYWTTAHRRTWAASPAGMPPGNPPGPPTPARPPGTPPPTRP